ncbi:MAG: HD domain-containing protein [Lachnospiraceae bacterium]|nr:HD domain-containing protein [Lachnospiraceae bacterium]
MKKESRQMAISLSAILDGRDYIIVHHCHHVRRFTEVLLEKIVQFCPEYNLTKEDCEMIEYAALLHDVGKIEIPGKILQKPGRLTEDEEEMVQTHTRKGKKIFENLIEILKEEADRPFLECCAQVCMSHHERYDGSGYPQGLVGEEIPIAAQIVGLADAYDDLVSERIYKFAYTKEEAFDKILEGEGGAFSPRLLEIFQIVRMELEEALEQEGAIIEAGGR